MPALPFLLRHSQTNDNFLFDLSFRKDYNSLPPVVVRRIDGFSQPIIIPQDVVESLRQGGLRPEDVNHICLSHIHWDHVGNPTLFPRATFLVGAGARPFLENGYPKDPNSAYLADLLPSSRTRYLDPSSSEHGEWKPIGPFAAALDFYGDGSLYIIDAPGHMPGHLNVLARTSPDGGWIYLAGDSAHHPNILTGEGRIAVYKDEETGGEGCLHKDREMAEEHVERIRELMSIEVGRVRVMLAHDAKWYEENKGGDMFWPGSFESL